MQIGDAIEIKWANKATFNYRVKITDIGADAIIGDWETALKDGYTSGKGYRFTWNLIHGIRYSTKELEPEIFVKLNEEYSAQIKKAGTKVGCQTFENDRILAVADAIRALPK